MTIPSRIRTRITRTITTQTFRIEVTIRVVVFDRITISIVTRTEDSADDKNFKAEGHQDEFQQVEHLNKIIIIFSIRGDERFQRRDRLKQRDCQRLSRWKYIILTKPTNNGIIRPNKTITNRLKTLNSRPPNTNSSIMNKINSKNFPTQNRQS